MSYRLLKAMFIPALLALVSCGDDSAGPHEIDQRSELAGAWRGLSVTNGDRVTPLPEGYTYWHFTDSGIFCDETISPGDIYTSTICGNVSRDLVLTGKVMGTTMWTWQLVLSADSDSLSALLIEAADVGADRWDLVREEGRAELGCTCE